MRLTIWQRIFLTLALPIFLASLLIVLALYDLRIIYQKVHRIEALDDINLTLMQLRRYEKNMILFEEDEAEYLTRFNEYIDQLKNAVRRSKHEIIQLVQSKQYKNLIIHIENYDRNVHQVVTNLELRLELTKDIRPAGRELFDAASDKETVLELRRYEKNYIIYKEQEAVKKVHEIAAVLASQEPAAARQLSTYQTIFDALVYSNTALEKDFQSMREYARQIEERLQEIAAKERQDIHDTIIKARNFFIAALIIIVAASAIGGYFLSHVIVRTLKNMERAFKNLVNGDTLVKVYTNDGPEEIRHLVDSYNQTASEINNMRQELNSAIKKLKKTNQTLLSRQEELVEARKMTAMRLLSSEIAHEINNPISSLTLLLQLFHEQMEQENPKKPLVKQMLCDIQRCQMVLHELVDFARKEPLKLKLVSPAELIHQAIDVVKRQHTNKTVHVTTAYEHLPEQAVMDPVLIHQVLVNIITNAWQFTPENGAIEIQGIAEDGHFAITVKDTGPGIAEDVLPNIFEPFFSTRKGTGGTGLGLAIANKIVDRHRGRIFVESTAGRGTTFTVTLPVEVPNTF